MDQDNTKFLPFHAINEFMLDEYRYKVIEKVLNEIQSLSGERRARINSLIKNNLKIPGFRNSSLAPISMKMKDAIRVYKRNPDFVAQILASWSELQPELTSMVYKMLDSRGWELQPLEIDRSTLPGFQTDWNKEETYDVLDKAFFSMFPDCDIAGEDDVRLMIVWISGKLPYELFEDMDIEEKGS